MKFQLASSLQHLNLTEFEATSILQTLTSWICLHQVRGEVRHSARIGSMSIGLEYYDQIVHRWMRF